MEAWACRSGSMDAGARGWGWPAGSREAPPSPPPRPCLSRFLVRDVPSDHFVHGLASVPDALFADREIDGGHALGGRHTLHFLARHVAHESGGNAVEPRRRLLGPPEAGALTPRRGPGEIGRFELRPREQGVPARAELLPPDGLLDHRQGELAGDDGDLPRARVLLHPPLRAAPEVGVGHLA